MSFKVEICCETVYNSRFKQFIKFHKHNILSFDFADALCLDKFFEIFIIDSLFVHLEILIIQHISMYKLLILLFYLKSLPKLNSLSFSIADYEDDLSQIYQMIFCLSLKYFLMETKGYLEFSINRPIDTQNPYLSIEYLLIYHRCTLNQLINIISHTPKLSHLYCFKIIKSDQRTKSKLLIKLNDLIHLRVTLNHIKFNEFEQFLLKLCCRLQFLKVKIHSTDKSFLDADRWERFILENIPLLSKFIYHYIDIINQNFKISPYHLLINRFTSSFWIDRKWIFKILVEDDKLIYLVRPYKYVFIVKQNLYNILFSLLFLEKIGLIFKNMIQKMLLIIRQIFIFDQLKFV